LKINEEDAITGAPRMTEIYCASCGKQIWSINSVSLKPGVELPTFLHTVCYERLEEK